jgi:hypothetical protein
MKVELQSMIAASLLLVSPQAVSLGPEGCVSLRQSELGSCVISTNCKGLDTSNFEFAFGCENTGVQGTSLVRHSFGLGGFDSTEEFDTEVKCSRCLAPTARMAVADTHVVPMVAMQKQRSAQQLLQTRTAMKATASRKRQGFLPLFGGPKPAPGAELVSYGPNSCVSTYKSEEGHCILETKCQNVAIEKYNIGLICVDKVGAPVRHNFGKGSFAAEEVFDTLIPCDQCLGTEDIPDALEMNGRVMTLSKEVMKIDSVLSNISSDLKIIGKVVASVGVAPAPAPAPAPDVLEAASPAAELATVKEHAQSREIRSKESSKPKAAEVNEPAPAKKAAALVMSAARAEVDDSTLDEATKEAEQAAAAAEAEAIAAEQVVKTAPAVATAPSTTAAVVQVVKTAPAVANAPSTTAAVVKVVKTAPAVATAPSTTAAVVKVVKTAPAVTTAPSTTAAVVKAVAKQVKVEPVAAKNVAASTAAVQVAAKTEIAPAVDVKKSLDNASDDEVLENLLK